MERQADLMLAEIKGLERARDLFSVPEKSAGRRDVQGPVMAMLNEGGKNEGELVSETGLPPEAVHKFIVRAVRDGKLIQMESGLIYVPQREAAE
jgi:hypothetical protein